MLTFDLQNVTPISGLTHSKASGADIMSTRVIELARTLASLSSISKYCQSPLEAS